MKCSWCKKNEVGTNWSDSSFCAECMTPTKERFTGRVWPRHFIEWMEHPDREKENEARKRASVVGGYEERTKAIIAEIKAIGERMSKTVAEAQEIDSKGIGSDNKKMVIPFGEYSFREREAFFDRKARAANQGDENL